jgi:hypothetical protein
MLFEILSQEKRDGETKNDFSSRINSEVSKALNLPEVSERLKDYSVLSFIFLSILS